MENFATILILGVLLGGIYALISVGLSLIFGVIRIINFAHGELVMLGMYVTYYSYVWLGLSPYVAILIVAPVLFVVGVVIQKLIMEPLLDEPMMQVFASFGLLILLENSVLALTRGQPLSLPPSEVGTTVAIFGVTVSFARVVALVAVTLITIGLHLFLRRTMMGKAVRAVTQDKRAAATMGINVKRTYMLTFGLGAAITGVAGAFLTPIYTLQPTIGGSFGLAAFAVVVLGGLGSIWGAYAGGMIIGLAEVFSGFYIDPALKSAVWFLIFVVVLVARPAGLFGMAGSEILREQK
jgi:branched-chain amino acid transport system permease protein